MKYRALAFGFMLCFLLLGAARADDKANFGGVWIMDKAKSEGVPPNMDQKMRVTIEGEKLELETDLFVDDNVNTVHDQYFVNGKEVEFTAHLGELEAKGKRVAKWATDGKGLEVHDEAVFETPQGKVNTTMLRKWTMSADGKTVVIELNFQGPNGPVTSKRTFNRK
jgi:hypothetical protein